MPGPFFYEAHGDQILVWCTTVFLDLAAGGGNSTVTDISLLLRMSPSFTLAALSLSRAASLARRSPTERSRSPFREMITSPAFRPAFCATESVFTSRTRMPSPSGAPKKLPS